MAKKIFVSYKHGDSSVRPIRTLAGLLGQTTARSYVDDLILRLGQNGHIYKGEGNESLAEFKDDTIESKLKDKIFDTSTTIVLISKNMKNLSESEDNQWIPWEISYSLREQTREGKTSKTNALLAVVIPDEQGSYEYFIQNNGCVSCQTITWKTNTLFGILGKNMFNRKQPKKIKCTNTYCDKEPHTGNDHSYIHPVKWDEFIGNIDGYINTAIEINKNMNDYEIVKTIS